MTALLRKELRALRPFALLILATFTLGLLYTFSTEFPDQQPFTVEELKEDEGGRFVMTLLFAILIGAGLLVRESEEGTLHFLDGLPVSRSRIFAAKFLAGFLVLCLVPAIDLGTSIVLGILSRSSVDPPPPWGVAGAVFGLNFLAVFSCLALAMACSFLRQWFAIAVGLAVCGFLWFGAQGVTWVGWLSPLSLEPELVGGKALVPWEAAWAQLALGVAALGVAWAGFHQLGARSRDFVDRRSGRRLARAISALVMVGTPAVWVAVLVLLSRSLTPPEDPMEGKPLGEQAFARHETEHYEFLFRESQREAAQELIDAADEVHDTVARFLGAAPSPARIVVDLASPVIPHAAGQTNWTKVRIPLEPDMSLDELRLILGHETTHVFDHQLADNRLDALYRHVRFFDEGLATYVDQRFFGENGDRSLDRHAAAAHARGAVPIELLCDDTELEKQRDPELVYSLGRVFCRALVESSGEEAPARVLRAFKTHERTPGADGPAVWRAMMQRAGLDFDRVVAAYDAEMARLARVEAEFVAKLPRLSGSAEVVGEEIVIRAKYEGAAPGRVICAVPKAVALVAGQGMFSAGEDGTIRLPRRIFTGRAARTMLGWSVDGMRLPVFEPWVETEL